MRAVAFVVAGAIDARTGGSIYNRKMIGALRSRGWAIDLHELPGTYPDPTDGDLAAAAAVLRSLPDAAAVVVDGLAFSAMPDVIAAHRHRLRFVPLIHMPLALEVGLDPVTAATRRENERRALADAAQVVATGPKTKSVLTSYGVPPSHIVIVPPGTDAAPIAAPESTSMPRLICVAAVTPGKGHDMLVRALAGNRDLDWRLTCAGSLTRCPATVERVRKQAASSGIDASVEFTGELGEQDLAAQYARADLFVLATRFETFGMAVAEALARAIPVVATDTGEIRSLVGDAGVVVPVDDAQAFAMGVRSLLSNSERRKSCRAAAMRIRNRLPGWDRAAAVMARALERVVV